MIRYLFLAGLLSGALLTAACSTTVGVSSSVDAAVVGLTTAERLALIYTSLPRCPAPAPCSDPATVQKIKDLDLTAYNAVKAAEKNEALLSGALTAISAFQSAVPITVH